MAELNCRQVDISAQIDVNTLQALLFARLRAYEDKSVDSSAYEKLIVFVMFYDLLFTLCAIDHCVGCECEMGSFSFARPRRIFLALRASYQDALCTAMRSYAWVSAFGYSGLNELNGNEWSNARHGARDGGKERVGNNRTEEKNEAATY
ncbi:MAG: hypothetical protein ACOYW7_02730 [Nitrospirota bacterium]